MPKKQTGATKKVAPKNKIKESKEVLVDEIIYTMVFREKLNIPTKPGLIYEITNIGGGDVLEEGSSTKFYVGDTKRLTNNNFIFSSFSIPTIKISIYKIEEDE